MEVLEHFTSANRWFLGGQDEDLFGTQDGHRVASGSRGRCGQSCAAGPSPRKPTGPRGCGGCGRITSCWPGRAGDAGCGPAGIPAWSWLTCWPPLPRVSPRHRRRITRPGHPRSPPAGDRPGRSTRGTSCGRVPAGWATCLTCPDDGVSSPRCSPGPSPTRAPWRCSPGTRRPWTEVETAGAVDAVRAARASGRTLFLCWPPFDDDGASYAALRAYQGDTFIYAGGGTWRADRYRPLPPGA